VTLTLNLLQVPGRLGKSQKNKKIEEKNKTFCELAKSLPKEERYDD